MQLKESKLLEESVEVVAGEAENFVDVGMFVVL